jgi:hypothetical protein
MTKSKIILPRVFEDRSGKHSNQKGKPKLSYSQYTSYKDPLYQDDYYVQYFSGINLPSGEFAEFGSSCGEYIEDVANKVKEPRVGCLSEEDIKFLDESIDFPEGCVYEDEIIVDMGDICSEGYADRITYYEGNKISVRDYKTLNIKTKSEFYASEEYGQTSLYSFQKEREGYTIVNSEVFGLGRKGSSFNGTGNFKMRLSGDTIIIPTPYTTERGQAVVDSMLSVAKEISEDYKVFLKYFT